MRKSLWSPDEDEKLRCYVATHGCGNWSDVAKHTGLHRCGKSCRLRWINYLRPDLKRGPFTAHEVRLVVNLHKTMGNSWSKIATQLPGRTDNDVKNFWHSYTRSRRIQEQQQQQANRTHQGSTDGNNDQQGSSSNEQYHNGIMQWSGLNDQRHNVITNSTQYIEGLGQLQSLNPQGSIKGLAGLCKNVNTIPNLSGCKPTSQPYNALSHTHMSSNNSFDHSSHNVAPPHDHEAGSHVLISTDEANITHHLTHMHLPPSSQDTNISALFYKAFPPHPFNDPCCSKVSSMSFQHFPSLNAQASDHSNIIPAPLSGGHVIMDSAAKLKTALQASGPAIISPLISHVRPHHPHGPLVDYSALSFDSARSLPAAINYAAVKHEAAADAKPPEGLESVIWSYLKGQPEASSSTSAGASDDYNKEHYVASNHHHYHLNQVIKPQSGVSNYISSDHHPHHPQISSDPCTNTESLSYTSPTNLQCLQAQYLADCFS